MIFKIFLVFGINNDGINHICNFSKILKKFFDVDAADNRTNREISIC